MQRTTASDHWCEIIMSEINVLIKLMVCFVVDVYIIEFYFWPNERMVKQWYNGTVK